MTSRMIYQIYTQRLTNEQHIFMRQVSDDYLLRSKHERQAIDPSISHLVYQFSRKSSSRRVPIQIGSPPLHSCLFGVVFYPNRHVFYIKTLVLFEACTIFIFAFLVLGSEGHVFRLLIDQISYD